MIGISSALRRRVVAAAVCLAAVGGACASAPDHRLAAATQAAPSDAEAAAALCRTIPHRWLGRMVNTFRSDWSGEVQYLPRYPNPVDGGLSHAGPWDHLQHVPLMLYGPGFIKPGTYHRSVGLTDIAPTSARLVGSDLEVPDGEPLTMALLPASDRAEPKLVVTLVWDSAGMDVLDRWPNEWPYLHSLIERGAWFTDAQVGIGNSNTPPGHAAIGTGAFPSTSGYIDEFAKYGGSAVWVTQNLLLWPTFGDVYDRANDNRPLVGTVATLGAHASMMSHGALWNGGDRDILVTREAAGGETGGAEAVSWNLPAAMQGFFRLPGYVNDMKIDPWVRQLDLEDGSLDGLWRGHDIEQMHGGFDTPARTPYQSELIEMVVRREGFGKDDVPDLLYLNYKTIDGIGHAFGMDTVEMQDAVRYQDEALRQLVGFLNEQVGEGLWTLTVTADHGSQIPAEVSGGIPIDPTRMRTAITKRFDDDGDDVELFMRVRPTQLWVDDEELEDNGLTTDEIARFIGGLTVTNVARSDFAIPPGHEDDLAYEAAFPDRLLEQLPCVPPDDG